eukprot:5654834-Prymnesium_polylepis.1
MTAVDMQPRCIDLVLCHLAVNGVPHSPRIAALNRYVAADEDAPPLQVPSRACDSMAAPTATGGRRPDGRFRGTQNRLNQTQTSAVYPLALGKHMLTKMRSTERIAVVKIDTEGFEPRVLQSLRPVWHFLDGGVVIELQPHSWARNRIDTEEAFGILRDFGAATGFVVVTLPHAAPIDSATSQERGHAVGARVDPCLLSPLPVNSDTNGTAALALKAITRGGITMAVTMNFWQLELGLRHLLEVDGHRGSFHDVLLRRGCLRGA